MRLTAPLSLRVEREGAWVTVWSDELEEVGYGPHLSAAVEDFQSTVAELSFSLRADQARLGPDMARLWGIAQRLIEERL